MLKPDGKCDRVCKNCEYENKPKECLITLLTTIKAKVAVIEPKKGKWN